MDYKIIHIKKQTQDKRFYWMLEPKLLFIGILKNNFLSGNNESSKDETGEERDKLQDTVNKQFDEIESEYKQDVE